MYRFVMYRFVVALVCLVALVGLSALSGCELKEQADELKETRQRVKDRLQDIKNRGAIDLEVRQMLSAVYTAYTSYLTNNSQPPSDWSDLNSVSGLTVDERLHITTAKTKIDDMAWGARLERLEDEARAEAKLCSVENSVLGNVVILQADGDLRTISRRELKEVEEAQ